MITFVAMFTPAAALLATGVQPTTWSVEAPCLDIALQRAGILAHGHTGHEQNITEHAGTGAVSVYATIHDEAPSGQILVVEAR